MWVDAAYGVHSDMRSHTGGTMSFGHGVVHHKSSVQKLNTKSSTESELVGTSEYLPYNIWLKNFMSAQGYDIKDNILFQDNQSAIKMENNGKRSCTGNSRHINIRHFFVTDRVKKKEIRILYCPTNRMLADFFTKPLQGSLFIFYKRIIMGYDSIYEVVDVNSEMKERVGNWARFNNKLISEMSQKLSEDGVNKKKSTRNNNDVKTDGHEEKLCE